MDFILRRFQEPSTYAGISAFLASMGLLGLTETDWNQVLGAAAAITAAASVLMKEHTPAAPQILATPAAATVVPTAAPKK